jgi:hypothetical protein
VIVATAEEVHARNVGRSARIVPADVVDRHLAGVARLGTTADEIAARLVDEGFAAAWVLLSAAEVDGLRVVRVPRQPSRTRPKARARSSTQTPFRK